MPVTVSSLMMTICCLWPFVSMMDLAGPDFRSQATLKTWWRQIASVPQQSSPLIRRIRSHMFPKKVTKISEKILRTKVPFYITHQLPVGTLYFLQTRFFLGKRKEFDRWDNHNPTTVVVERNSLLPNLSPGTSTTYDGDNTCVHV